MKNAIIVLGHSAGKHKVSLRQKYRLDAAFDIWKLNKSTHLITTGGFGIFNRVGVSLAEKCAIYLISKGIPQEKILLADSSKNTREDAIQSMEIMQKHDLSSAMVVTSIDHMSRARRIFNEIAPRSISLSFHISDRWAGWWSIFDSVWHSAGWMKYFCKEIKKRFDNPTSFKEKRWRK